MPKKNNPTYREAINFNFKDILKVISFEDIKFVEFLEGEDRREMLRFCNEVYSNPYFSQIIKNFIYTQVMFTAEDGINSDQYWGGKMMCQGIKTVDDFFRKYAQLYDAEFKPPSERFDPHAAFSKAKI